MKDVHRKTKKTYNIPGHAHCLTYSCLRRLPLLASDQSRQWVIEAIRSARERHQMAVWAYVIMPDHVHLLVMPRAEHYSIEKFMFALKRPVSWRIKQLLLATGDANLLAELTVGRARRAAFRFWQPGGGFDRNVCSLKGVECVAEYLHANPVRRGLISESTDWYWSSARWWAGDKSGPLDMDPVTQ